MFCALVRTSRGSGGSARGRRGAYGVRLSRQRSGRARDQGRSPMSAQNGPERRTRSRRTSPRSVQSSPFTLLSRSFGVAGQYRIIYMTVLIPYAYCRKIYTYTYRFPWACLSDTLAPPRVWTVHVCTCEVLFQITLAENSKIRYF